MSDAEALKEIKEIFLSGNLGSPEEVLFGLLMIIVALVLVVTIIGIAFLVLDVIGKWKMFKKAGESGWKALIPIYNTYTQCMITGVSPWWLVIICICYLISTLFTPFEYIVEIVVVYFSIILSLSTAKSYGKTTGFGIGIFLISPVFNMILGFDSSKYEGKKQVGDLLSSTPVYEPQENEKPKKEKTTKNSKKATPAKKTTTTKKVKDTKVKKTSTKTKTTSKKTTTKKTAPKKTTTRKTTKKSTKK